MRRDWRVWAASQKVRKASQRAVLTALADQADATGACFATIAELAEASACATRTVQNKLNELEALGLVRREIGGGWIAKGIGRANGFQLAPGSTDTREGGKAVPDA